MLEESQRAGVGRGGQGTPPPPPPARPLGSSASLRHVTCRRAHLRGTQSDRQLTPSEPRGIPTRGTGGLPPGDTGPYLPTAPPAPHLGSLGCAAITWPRPGSGPHAGPAPSPRPCPRSATFLERGLRGVARGSAGPGPGSTGEPGCWAGRKGEVQRAPSPSSLAPKASLSLAFFKPLLGTAPIPGLALSLLIHFPILGTCKVRCGAGGCTRS